MDQVFLIWPMTDDPAVTELEQREIQRAKYQNPDCGHWIVPRDAKVALSQVGCVTTDLNFTEIPPQRLISPRLASYLPPGNELLLSVLPVTLADGTESHWLQYDTCFKVQIRGGMKSYCFRCKQCHRIFYTPMGSWYLLRDDLPPRAVFGTTSGAICVRQPIAENLQEQRWPKLSIKPIEVKDSPIDGLSKDIETLTPDMERRIAGSRF